MRDTMNNRELLDDIAYNVIRGNINADYPGHNMELKGQPGVIELMRIALDEEIDPKKIIVKALSKPMEEVSEKFKNDAYLAPQILTSAQCVGDAMDMLAPYLKKSGIKQAKFVIATVKGDFHETGPLFVVLMLKGAGFKTINLGYNVSSNRIVKTVKNHKAAYVGLSTSFTPARKKMGDMISKMTADGLRDEVKVLIGGSATSAKFAEQIGADAYCKNAFQIIDVLKSLDNWSGFAGANIE
jgi:5-methyltetrahydrofolate--homocysteine methyltransferase